MGKNAAKQTKEHLVLIVSANGSPNEYYTVTDSFRLNNCQPRDFSASPSPEQHQLTSKLKLGHANFFKVSKANRRVAEKPRLTGATRLPNASMVPSKFRIISVTPGISRCCSEEDKLFMSSDEDSTLYGQFRLKMFAWYVDTIVNASKMLLLFHGMLSHSAYILLNKISKPYAADQYPAGVIKRVAQFAAYNRGKGLQLAQETILRINNHVLSRFTYAKLVASITSYSSINIALTFFADSTYGTLLTFLDGFFSVSSVKEIVLKFNKAIAEIKTVDAIFYNSKLLYLELFESVQAFVHSQIISMFVPNYDPLILHEFHEDLKQYRPILVQNSNATMIAQFDELGSFIDEVIPLADNNFQQPLQSLSDTDPETIFCMLRKSITLYASECVFFASNYKSMCLFDRIARLYWIACTSILNSLFNECMHLFMCRFEGCVFFPGIDIRLFEYTLDELDRTLKHKDYDLYDKLYRRVIYLSRLISSLRYRWRVLTRNLSVKQPYPSFLKGGDELCSRKVRFLEEEVLTNIKKTRIRLEHYPRNPSTPVDGEWPNSVKFAKFDDSTFYVDQNTDSNYSLVEKYLSQHSFSLSTIPLEYLKLSKFGLLMNIDYRPNLLGKWSFEKDYLATIRLNIANQDQEVNEFTKLRLKLLTGQLQLRVLVAKGHV